ncbi:unnamed protein product [Arabidopsis thaliana]|uniref:TF-B3 domain-containing protein n=1 Tax=Arabidopsis thaliana TaxID=3702 RepID=A0A5S9WZ95_ARATH|nr:unnamed protein product [Arabidopsis thaliana]
MVRAFAYEEIGETSTEAHASAEDNKRDRTRRVINYNLRSTTMISSLSKRLKIDECKNQDPEQNPNRVASSPSLCHVKSKRPQKGVSNKPILDMDFLNEEELEKIDRHYKKISDSDKGADVILVNSEGLQRKLKLKRWDMTSTSNYVLGSGWNKVVTENILETGTRLRLWSFHSPDMLFFDLVLSDPDLAPTKDWECLNLLAKLSVETACLEASQDADTMSSLVSDTELDLELRL